MGACDLTWVQENAVISPRCASLTKRCDATETALFFDMQALLIRIRLFTCGLQPAVPGSACDLTSLQENAVISPRCASLIKQCDATETALFFGMQALLIRIRLFTCGLQPPVQGSACDLTSLHETAVISPRCASLIKQCDATETALF